MIARVPVAEELPGQRVADHCEGPWPSGGLGHGQCRAACRLPAALPGAELTLDGWRRRRGRWGGSVWEACCCQGVQHFQGGHRGGCMEPEAAVAAHVEAHARRAGRAESAAPSIVGGGVTALAFQDPGVVPNRFGQFLQAEGACATRVQRFRGSHGPGKLALSGSARSDSKEVRRP